ncbi:hypothetical protein [Neobacillus niacini]|uniref:hypothetical protein n=1 Tax=Neobacillus niacini TaxID=86668 RepID=UPI0021CB7E98|nr:hypothetical protein [Neobacillus niacini]
MAGASALGVSLLNVEKKWSKWGNALFRCETSTVFDKNPLEKPFFAKNQLGKTAFVDFTSVPA